jgi:hypothetical protein
MQASDLTDKWVNKELPEEKIEKYLCDNLRAYNYHDAKTINHVADLCHQIYMWSTGQYGFLDDFLEAIVKNDLFEAVHLADDKNRTALWLYVAFLYNVAPGGWRGTINQKTDVTSEIM